MYYFIHRPFGNHKLLPTGHQFLAITLTLTGILFSIGLHAQTADGNNGLNQANTMVRSYFEAGTNLMYAVGAILGLVGAVKVYKASLDGQRQDAGHLAAAWFGACIFLVVVSTVLKSFFGL